MRYLITFFVFLFAFPLQADPPQAELILHNGKIWAGGGHHYTALVIAQGKVLFAGGDTQALVLRREGTRVIDLAGKRVVPGLHDTHVHFLNAGLFLSQIDLKDAANEEEFGKRLRDFDRKLPKGRWMLGGNWDHDRTFGGTMPTAALLDKYVAADRPVFLRRYDGHMALANTHVLKLAGITADTKDPAGGEVVRLPDGQPSGVLRDNAMGLVDGRGLIPGADEAQIVEGVQRALQEARSVGVTAIDDIDGGSRATRHQLWRLYQSMEKQGTLTCRVRLFWPIADWKDLADLIAKEGRGAGLARLGGVKGFMDGSLGSGTAKMFAPFLNERTTGVWVTPPSAMRTLIADADAAGLQVVVHAIGDEANATLLDLFGELRTQRGERDRRFRIEHAQHLRREDYVRFQQTGTIASMQPYHIIDDGRWAEGRIGTERCSSSYAYRSLLDNKAALAMGSDWPVAPLNPLLGIDAAVNRRTLDDKHPSGWFPAQKITVEEALRGYTDAAAHAMFAEKERGILYDHHAADLVVLDRDILDPAERDHIAKTKVLMTVVAGKVVYERK